MLTEGSLVYYYSRRYEQLTQTVQLFKAVVVAVSPQVITHPMNMFLTYQFHTPYEHILSIMNTPLTFTAKYLINAHTTHPPDMPYHYLLTPPL